MKDVVPGLDRLLLIVLLFLIAVFVSIWPIRHLIAERVGSESSLPASEPREQWTFFHPKNYSGDVWIQFVPQKSNINVEHEYILRWGPWEYKDSCSFNGSQSISLVHKKNFDESAVPLRVKISPAAYVRIGQGKPDDRNIVDINYGWKRVEE